MTKSRTWVAGAVLTILLPGVAQVPAAHADTLLDWSPLIRDTSCSATGVDDDWISFAPPVNDSEVPHEIRAAIREAGSDQGILKSVLAKRELIAWKGRHENTTYELWFHSNRPGGHVATGKSTVTFRVVGEKCLATITKQGTGGRWPTGGRP